MKNCESPLHAADGPSFFDPVTGILFVVLFWKWTFGSMRKLRTGAMS
jgi:hypothetical protein